MMDCAKLSLRTWLLGVLVATFVCPLLLFGLVYTSALTRVGEKITLESLEERGQLQAHALARQLYRPWRDISLLADKVSMENPLDLRKLLTHIVEADTRYLWLGIVRTDGTVYAASSGVMEGQQVSGRPWFESGLVGPFAGAYDRGPGTLAMLPRHMTAKRIFHFAAPIRDAAGHTIGVLGAYFDWNEVRAILTGLDRGNTQTLLVSGNLRVLFGPNSLLGESLSLSNVIPDRRIEPTARIETWPDGHSYATVTVPEIEYHDLPSFGWRLVVRQEADETLKPVHWLVRHFWMMLGAGIPVTLGILALLANYATGPIRRIADFSTDLARGNFAGHPPDEHAYQEAQKLSSALLRLQSQLMQVDEDSRQASSPDPVSSRGVISSSPHDHYSEAG